MNSSSIFVSLVDLTYMCIDLVRRSIIVKVVEIIFMGVKGGVYAANRRKCLLVNQSWQNARDGISEAENNSKVGEKTREHETS